MSNKIPKQKIVDLMEKYFSTSSTISTTLSKSILKYKKQNKK